MIIEFFKKINQYQRTHFTYRQRFIFFSCVFLMGMPLPTYWMYKAQNFLILRWENQLKVLPKVELLQDLLNQILDLQVQPDARNILKTNIEKTIHQLNRENPFYITTPSPLIGGFSEATRIEANFALFDADLQTVLQTTNFEENLKLSQSIRAYIEQIGLQFELFLSLDNLIHELIINNLRQMPRGRISLVRALEAFNQKRPTDDLLFLLKRHERRLESVLININYLMQDKPPESLVYRVYLSYKIYQNALRNFINALNNAEETDTLIVKTTFNQAINAHTDALKLNFELLYSLLHESVSSGKRELFFYFAVLVTVFATLGFYIWIHMLTSHLFELRHHIQELSKGNFTTCFCSNAKDEFGPMGIAFDKMGLSVQMLIQELFQLGNQLTESIGQITKTAQFQSEIVKNQESNVANMENAARGIAQSTRDLADKMNQLSQQAKRNILADDAKRDIQIMQNKMLELITSSASIFNGLEVIKEKVNNSKVLIALMTRISDQASLLSLNSSIETAYSKGQQENYKKITYEIQRFAEKTAESTADIQEIIKHVNQDVEMIKNKANYSLTEINQGIKQLLEVSQQLSHITMQGDEQSRQFESLNETMQTQADSAQRIINFITSLRQSTQENVDLTEQLYKTNGKLGETTVELQQVLNLFFQSHRHQISQKNEQN